MGHYEVLGVARDADAAEVRRAYLRLARAHHPDRSGGDLARMRAVNAAWTILGDPARRRTYDLEHGLGRVAPTAPGPEPPDPLPDLDDDVPVRVTVVLPPALALLPAGLFAGSVASGVLGLVLGIPALLGFSLLAFVLSVLFFMASPFLALYASRRPTREGPAERRR